MINEGKMEKHVILITGVPRSGKSTLINLIRNKLLKTKKVGGVTCSEINNVLQERIGFRASYYASQNYYPLSCELAKINLYDNQNIKNSEYVEFKKYLVNVYNIKNFIVPAIKNSILNEDIIVVDEIASMQLFCQDFKECIEKELFNSKKLEIVTLSEELYNSNKEFIKNIKNVALDSFCLKPTSNFEEIINEICNLIDIFMKASSC